MKTIQYYTIDADGISLILDDGTPFVIASDHENFAQIKGALQAGQVQKALRLAEDKRAAVTNYSKGKFTVVNNVLTYCGIELHDEVAKKALDFMQKNIKVDSLLNFIEKLLRNPSPVSRATLYRFIAKNGITITPDGDILFYKSIRRDNWKDWHTNTISNHVGADVKMDRDKVVEDPSSHCHAGLHTANFSFAKNYYGGPDSRIIVVSVNPSDVVSVPNDCDQKVRVCRYKVLAEYEGDDSLKGDVYNHDLSEVTEKQDDCYLDDCLEDDCLEECGCDKENPLTDQENRILRYVASKHAAGVNPSLKQIQSSLAPSLMKVSDIETFLINQGFGIEKNTPYTSRHLVLSQES